MKRLIQIIKNLFSTDDYETVEIVYDKERGCYFFSSDTKKRVPLYSETYARRVARWNCLKVLN